MFELAVFGACKEQDWMRLEFETKRFREYVAETSFHDDYADEKLVPIMAFANTSDRICLDPRGRLVDWRRDEIIELKDSFAETLRRLVVGQTEYAEALATIKANRLGGSPGPGWPGPLGGIG